MMKLQISIAIACLVMVSPLIGSSNYYNEYTEGNSSISLLFSRLNTDSLFNHAQFEDDQSESTRGNALLHYFRSREGIHHPINREERESYKGKIATEGDFEVAEDALLHIFVGQSAYPRFFCGEDIDWGFRPVPDNEWVWQLNRMSFWDAMGKAYWHTGDEKYARAWAEQMKDWVRKNPNDDNHAYAWRSIEAGIRGNRWVGLFQRFIDSPHFTPEVLVIFLNGLYDHASYLMTKYTTGSNWALMEAEGMAAIAFLFPEFKDAEKWKEEAIRRLKEEIHIQVYPDGHQNELAMGYHTGSIDWFFRTYQLAMMNGLADAFPGSYIEQIEKMCEVPMKLSLPNGTNVQFGDAWEGSPGQHNARFKRWADFFDRADFLYLGTGGKEGKRPDSTAYVLPVSGLYSMRSDWTSDAICLVLKCGPDGGWHSHPDNGTFDLYAGDRNLMPDAGCYIYSGDPEGRAWFRQTKVHQTLTLDGKNSKYDPRLLLWQPGDELDILVVENRSYDQLTHRRSVFFVDKRYFVIVDDAIGDAAGEVAIHFQLAPGDAFYNTVNNSVSTGFDEGWNVLVQNQSLSTILQEEEGWVSFKYTVKEPRPAFCYKIDKDPGQRNVRFVTLVAPFEKEPPRISVKSLQNFQSLPLGIELEVEENGNKKRIGCIID